MASTYITKQGDCWDLLAFRLYGDEKYMKLLIEANWPLLDILVFESGTEITVPDIPEEYDEDDPIWRQEGDEDDEEGEYYSSTDDDDEEGESDE